MEHINVKKLTNGYYKLTPEKGYILQDKISNRLFLEADIEPEDINNWRAVEIEQ